ncbi:hypothetical protein ACN20G_21965 [Streptomyces sp. BI20]|uniref:hypothetical protein n=1 Tax=Streptomyces sp. BI20 TaxID=3403460 RepID=UPI003C76F9C3
MVLTALGSAVGLLVDDRVLTGAPIWAKPFKFAVSFVAYSLSLAWAISLLPRFRRVAWWAGTAVVATSLIEMVLIVLQVFRGRRSHFNQATPFDVQVYDAMAGTVVVLWLATLLIALCLLRAPLADRATAWALRLGSFLALAGAGVGFLMAGPTPEQLARGEGRPESGAHSVGVPDGGPGMFLTGWSTTGGDLRIPHFFGMHALQLLPLLVLALTALAPRLPALAAPRVRLRLVLVAAGLYTGLFALLTWQALRGQPLSRPDALTLGALAALLLAGAIGVLLALRPGPGAAPAPAAPEAPRKVPA